MKRAASETLACTCAAFVGVVLGEACDRSAAHAVEAAVGADAASALGVASGPNPAMGVALGAWIFYPSFMAGAFFNDNIFATTTDRKAGAGVRLTPSFEADDEEGIRKTSIIGILDAQLYPSYGSASGGGPSTVTGQLGFTHVWAPTADWTLQLSGDYARSDSMFGPTLAVGTGSTFVGAPSALNVTGFRQFADQFTGAFWIEKKISEQFFVRTGGGVEDLVYEAGPSRVGVPLSGIDDTAFVRAGIWMTPQIDAFVETGADFRRYSNIWYDTNAYRVVGGLGSDLIGLFRGEIYGGYQEQYSAEDVFGSVSAPAFGGTIYYYPMPYFTLAASVDQLFGSAAAPTTAPASPNSQTWQTRFQADYGFSEYWTVSLRVGYAQTRYSGGSLTEGVCTADAGVSYTFWRNVALTLDYQFLGTSSNTAAAQTYSQNLVTAGITYSY